MAKTLKDFLEGYLKVKSADEQKFIDKHVTAKNPDRNGNGDDVFGASKVKTIDRRKERKGYNPGEDEKVYEAVETERVKHPVGQRPKGPGWVLKSAGEQTGKDHNVWERKFKRVGTTNEELKGGQKKIDKNHNGKLDAHDFLLLRKKKKVAEEAEQIDELSRQTTSSYFNKAMNNRSAANRAGNTALAAKRTAGMATANDKMNPSGKSKIAAAGTIREEEVEQIAELSTGTLQSYRKKARAQGNKIIDNMKVGGGDWSKDQVNTKTLRKRAAGAQASGKQLVKRGESLKTEEADQIDESAKIAAHLIKRYGDNVSKSHVRSAANDFGVDASKLAKAVRAKLGKNTLGEEVEQIDELSRQTTSSYFNKAMNNRSAANRAGNTALAAKRTAGMATANDKMNPSGKSKIAAAGTIREEEVEQIAELSTGTLQSYRKKARAQGNKIIDNMKVGGGDWSKDQVNTKTLRKRAAGAQASGKQLVKRGESLKTEEADQIDESAKIAAHLIKRYGDNVSKSHVRSAANDFGVDASKLAKAVRAKLGKNTLGEEAEQIDEAGYSAKAARAGKDLGKPGKNFSKIASAAAKKYGSKAAGGRVAGAILAKLRKEEKLAELIADLSESHQRTMTNVFEKLNEDNKSKFLEACDTPDGVEQMLDFAINHRGE